MGARLTRGTRVEVEVEDLAFGGRGVGRVDGFVLMVDRAFPGDLALVEVTRRRRRHAEARTVEVLRRSERRVEPPCQHAGVCGGCRLMALDYPAQLDYKTRQVHEAIRRVGGLDDVDVRPTVASERRLHYRNKMEFSFGTDADRRPALGLHAPGRFDVVFQIEQCLLTSPVASEVIRFVVDEARAAALPYWDQNRGGFLRYLTWREGKHTGEHMVNFVTSEGEGDEVERLRAIAGRLQERFPSVVSVLRNINARAASVAVGQREEVWLGRDHIFEEMDGLRFQIRANTFFQANVWQASRLYARLIERAALAGDEHVVDLYSGVGTISSYLSRAAARVSAIETVEPSVTAAHANARLNGIDNVEFLLGDAADMERLLEGRPRPALVVVNPPRAGLHPKAMAALVRLRPARLGYVSCEPTTLARDLGLLTEAGYSIEPVEPFDMFPNTPHVESLAFATAAS